MCSHSARASVGAGPARGRRRRVRGLAAERGDDLVGVGRLLQVVVRAEAQRLDRGGDAAVAGEDDDARRRARARAARDELEPDRPGIRRSTTANSGARRAPPPAPPS